MPANTVEATLSSKYVDGITKGIETTAATIHRNLQTMAQSGSAFFSSMDGLIDKGIATLKGYAGNLRQMAADSDSSWKKMSLGAAGATVGIVAALAVAAKSIGSWLIDIAKEASAVTELKFAFESLSKTVGWQEDTLKRLKSATEGLVSSIDLLRNANRIMQSGLNISDKMYTELVGNIFRIAKASGVDGTQAINTMTDSLIRGNARGLQAIGIHLNVKDAISEAAAAAGQHANKLGHSTEMQTYWNELLSVTRAMVAKMPDDFVSLEDALLKTEKTWHAFFVGIGEGVNRSSVLQAMLVKLAQGLDTLGAKKEDVNGVAVAVNHLVLGALSGLQALANIFPVIWIPINAFIVLFRTGFYSLRAVIEMVGLAVSATLTAIAMVIDSLTFGKIPGMKQAIEFLQTTTTSFANVARETVLSATSAWKDGWGAVSASKDLAEWASKTAKELDGLKNQSMQGKKTLLDLGAGSRSAAVDQQKLNEQLKIHQELVKELNKNFSPLLAVYDEYFRKLQQINKDAIASERQKQYMRLQLAKETSEKLLKIEQDRNNQTFKEWQDLQNLMKVIQDGKSYQDLPQPYKPKEPKNLGDDPAHVALNDAELQRRQEAERLQENLRRMNDRNTPDWVKPLRDAHLELEKLNKIGMDPFHQTMQAMKDSVLDFGAQAGQAWANYWADLVSGQEGAGKRLLAAFVGMVGQMLVKNGVMLIQVGMAEMALASTMVGRFMGASHAAGAHAVAIGMVQAALGGAMLGAASAMTQSSQSSSSSSAPQAATSNSTSSQPKVIQVGAAGRSQDAGSATAPEPVQVEVKLALDTNGVIQVVEKNIRSNGRLRVAVVNA